MKTLLLSEGDLVTTHDDLAMCTGVTKLQQDLRGALLEPIGTDRFHPGWGSSLNDFLAQIADEDTRVEIESEINRVISNYAAVQRDKIESDIMGDGQTRFSTDEILARIRRVQVQVRDESVLVGISLTTVTGEVVVLNEAVA
jgi:phage baseplate assembly protein W